MRAGVLLTAAGPAHIPTHTVAPMVAKARSTAPFGEYLERLMDQSGFANKEQLGEACGVDATTIGRWMRGQRPPTIEKLRDVAPHLKVRLGDLLVAAGQATAAELGMVGSPPAPGPQLPAVLRSIMSRLASPRYKQRHKDVLLEFVQDDVDRWDSMIERIEEERAEASAEARRGRR